MSLPRLQLFEWEDLEWFPHAIRDLALDYLGFLEVRFALYKPVLPLLRRMFEQNRTLKAVDLCAGRGGWSWPCARRLPPKESTLNSL